MHDRFAIFSENQAITATAASTKDMLFMAQIGQGQPVALEIKITEAFNNLTSLTLEIEQTTEADTTFASAESVYTEVIALADLTLGKRPFLRFLPNIDKPRVRLYYTVTGTAPTTGKIWAGVVVGEDFPIKDGFYFSPRNPTGAAATAAP